MYRPITAMGTGFVLMWIAVSISPAADPTKQATTNVARTMATESAAHAEARRASVIKLDIEKGDATPAANGEGRLNIDELKTMLDNMGYDAKLDQYNDGTKYATVKIPHSNCTFAFNFHLSPDKTNWCLSSYLGDVKDPATVRADRLLKVLELENNAWPAYYTYSSKSNTVYYYRPVANSNLKPALLRTTLENAMDSMFQTSDTWDPANWSTAPANTPAAGSTAAGS